MNEENRQPAAEENLPGHEEPILLTQEVSSTTQDENPVSALGESGVDNLMAGGGAVEDDLAIALGYALTPEKIDQAIERVIEKLYSEKIEGLLVEAVQNKVSAEIEKIKKSLKGE